MHLKKCKFVAILCSHQNVKHDVRMHALISSNSNKYIIYSFHHTWMNYQKLDSWLINMHANSFRLNDGYMC